MVDSHFLIVKLSAIGDCLHATPVAEALKTVVPNGFVGWAVHNHCSPMVIGNPFVDEVHLWPRKQLLRNLLRMRREIRPKGYDTAIDLQGLMKSALIARMSGAKRIIGPSEAREGAAMLYTERVPRRINELHVTAGYLELAKAAVGKDVGNPSMRVPISGADLDVASTLLPTIRPLVVLNPSAGRSIKQWSPACFAELGDRLAREFRATLVVTGASSDSPLADAILDAATEKSNYLNLCGRTNLNQLGALFSKVDLFIGGDTGPMHMAQAVGTRVVAIFGPTNPDILGPTDARDRIATLRLDCSPCRHRECPIGHLCLKNLSPEVVFEHARTILVEGGYEAK